MSGEKKDLVKKLVQMEEYCEKKKEVELECVTEKEVIDTLVEKYAMDERTAKKIISELILYDKFELDLLGIDTYGCLEKIINGIYVLSAKKHKTPHEIVNKLKIDDSIDQEYHDKIKLIYHEAVEAQERYNIEIQLEGNNEKTGKWGGYYGGITAMSTASGIAFGLVGAGWAFLPAMLLGCVAGTASGISVKEITEKVESWYSKQHERCAKEDAKKDAFLKREVKFDQLKRELDKILYLKDDKK